MKELYRTPKNLLAVYPDESLPEGFRYPERFLDMVGKVDTRWYYPWYFTPPNSDAFNDMIEFLARQLNRNLVPFASLELGDGDVACFDGSDTSGNPAVIIAILDGSGRSYGFRDFDHWEAEAWEEAQSWDRAWLDE